MRAEQLARDLMEGVGLLHEQGFGRLKLFCYVKEGIGGWRHWLFAGETFPERASQIPKPAIHGSLPGWPAIRGESSVEIAEALRSTHPQLLEAARGTDPTYQTWFAELLARPGRRILVMESPFEAQLGGTSIATPYGGVSPATLQKPKA